MAWGHLPACLPASAKASPTLPLPQRFRELLDLKALDLLLQNKPLGPAGLKSVGSALQSKLLGASRGLLELLGSKLLDLLRKTSFWEPKPHQVPEKVTTAAMFKVLNDMEWPHCYSRGSGHHKQ